MYFFHLLDGMQTKSLKIDKMKYQIILTVVEESNFAVTLSWKNLLSGIPLAHLNYSYQQTGCSPLFSNSKTNVKRLKMKKKLRYAIFLILIITAKCYWYIDLRHVYKCIVALDDCLHLLSKLNIYFGSWVMTTSQCW